MAKEITVVKRCRRLWMWLRDNPDIVAKQDTPTLAKEYYFVKVAKRKVPHCACDFCENTRNEEGKKDCSKCIGVKYNFWGNDSKNEPCCESISPYWNWRNSCCNVNVIVSHYWAEKMVNLCDKVIEEIKKGKK